MRHWFTLVTFLTLAIRPVLAQVPDASDQAPRGASSVFKLFDSVSNPSPAPLQYSGPMTGVYFQFSGLALNPEDTSITSRNAGVNASLSDTDMTFSNGWGVGFAIGYDFNASAESEGRDVPIALDPRVEFETLFRFPSNSTPEIGDPDDPINDDPLLLTFGLNGYLDFDIKGPVDPYIGAGIGLTYVEFGDYGDYHWHHDQFGSYEHRHGGNVSDDFVASYQLMAGLSVQIDRNWSLYGGVRYFETDDVDIDAFMFDFTSTEIEFGARIMLR